MILVDTSVWIRGLRGRDPYKLELDRLLEGQELVGHELILGELLIGDKGGRAPFLAVLERLKQSATVAHGEVAMLVRHRRLNGRGISWIDAHLLASALAEGHQLWTADESLHQLALECGAAYEPAD